MAPQGGADATEPVHSRSLVGRMESDELTYHRVGMAHHYTEPSRLLRFGYRYLYDPLRAGYLRRLIASLELSGKERVLDFGSGAGSEAIYLAQALDRGGRLTCLDVSPTWLAEAQRRLSGFDNVTFLLGEAQSVGLLPDGFDLVWAHYVLHDVDRAVLPGVLEVLAHSLAPQGRFEVVEPATTRHGPSVDEVAQLIEQVGLIETLNEPIRAFGGQARRLSYRHR
jgi:SAM-dependent methyltransferase